MSKKTIQYEGNPDKRIIQRRIMIGEIKEEDLKDYLASLPDAAENAEEMTVVLEERH